jgi:hypothetical protein
MMNERKKIKLPRYPYGRTSSAYKKAKKWFSANGTNGYDSFDFPRYAGMPKSISSKLLFDEVDFIQDNWFGK